MEPRIELPQLKFKSLNHAISHWSETKPSAPALTFVSADGSEQKLTYAQLHQSALTLGARLKATLTRGERAVLVFEQGLDYLVAFLACSYSGVVAVTGSPPDELRKGARLAMLLEDSDASLILTNKSAYSTLGAIAEAANLPIILVDEPFDAILNFPVKTSADELMFLQYTSGSTSDPKGVMLTHGSINANLSMIVSALYTDESSVGVSWLPLYHDMGLILMALGPLYAGCPTYLMSPADFLRHPHRWLDLISRVRGTVTAAPDFAYGLCLDRVRPDMMQSIDLSSLHMMINGSEPIRLENVAAFYDRFSEVGLKRSAMTGGYGMAELGVYASTGPLLVNPLAFDAAALEKGRKAVVVSPSLPNNRKIAGCGVIEAPQLDVKIVDPETLQALAHDKVGEIWLAGASVGAGYWENPKATRATFGAKLEGSSANYLRTGDLGFLHNGVIHICGRIKEVIIVRGRNIFPSDICAAAESASDEMKGRRAAAFGIDTSEGEEVVIVCAAKVNSETYQATARKITAAVSVATGIMPAKILFVQNRVLKRTTSGKVQHSALKKDYLADLIEVDFTFENSAPSKEKPVTAHAPNATSETSAAIAPDWMVQRICDTCATVCECDAVGHDENLLERGLDSLRGLKLVGALEGHFHGCTKTLCLCDIVELKTPRKIADALVTAASSSIQTPQPSVEHFVELSI